MSAGMREELIDSLVYMSGAKSPVDIDATVVLLLAIFFFLMWYLNRTLFQPYLAMSDARHERIEGARAAGQDMKVEADRVLTDYESKLTEVRQAASGVRGEMKQAGKTREQEILQTARTEMDKIVGAAQAELDQEVTAAQADFDKRADELSSLIVAKVLGA